MAHMALPTDLKSESREMAVEGRSLMLFSKSFQFGPYRVTDVHRGWVSGKGFSIWGYSSSEAEQKYEFSMVEAGLADWVVQCTTDADWSQLETRGFLGGGLGIEMSSNRQLVCTLEHEDDGGPSRLFMAQSARDKVLTGIMKGGAAQIDISATHKLEGSPLKAGEPTGYVFHIGGRPVGAVEVINKGTVWLDGSETPEIRSALAATSAALLLYQDIKEIGEPK